MAHIVVNGSAFTGTPGRETLPEMAQSLSGTLGEFQAALARIWSSLPRRSKGTNCSKLTVRRAVGLDLEGDTKKWRTSWSMARRLPARRAVKRRRKWRNL